MKKLILAGIGIAAITIGFFVTKKKKEEKETIHNVIEIKRGDDIDEFSVGTYA